MEKENMKTWYKDMDETCQHLFQSEPTKENAILLASAIIIKWYIEEEEEHETHNREFDRRPYARETIGEHYRRYYR